MTIDSHALLADFHSWAQVNGIVTDGVSAKDIPNKGIGLVSTRPLKVSIFELFKTSKKDKKDKTKPLHKL